MSDEGSVGEAASQLGEELLALYDRALPEVYGYFLHRCGHRPTAEDLTSETFLAAARAVRDGSANPLGMPWLIGVARHKLADHWRRVAREDRLLTAVENEPSDSEDDWDAEIDRLVAFDVLGRLGEHHRLALTLRYVDGLAVPDVAAHMGRNLHATEALLVRARVAFRRMYESRGLTRGGGDAV